MSSTVCDGVNLPFMGAFDRYCSMHPAAAPESCIDILKPAGKNPEDIENLQEPEQLLHSALQLWLRVESLSTHMPLEPEENELQVEAFLRVIPICS